MSVSSGEKRQDDGREDEAIAEAKRRIESHRKGSGVITFNTLGRRPLADLDVTVSLSRHAFRFGCNLFMFGRYDNVAQDEQYRERFGSLFNYATLGFYWANYEPQKGEANYDYTEKVAAWCSERAIALKGHPLVWDHPSGSPAWLPQDDAEIRRLSTGRVRDIVKRFNGRVDIWDVVNEPTDLNRFRTPMSTWARHLGAVPYMQVHLAAAREANPLATLLVNDYRMDPAYFENLRGLSEDGKRVFDAVGLQSHMHDGRWPSHQVWEVCDRYRRLGVPLHFTETTLVSGPRLGPGENWGATTPQLEEEQADAVTKFYTAVFAHPATEALTWWDFSDQGAWQGAPAGLLRNDMSPKPAYAALHKLIRRHWSTNLTGHTDAQGRFAMRAFYGTYEVTARLPNGKSLTKTIEWQRGRTAVHFTI